MESKDMKPKAMVKVVRLTARTESMTNIDKTRVKARKLGAIGRVLNQVPGYNRNLYFVAHSTDANIAVYDVSELEQETRVV